MKLSTPFSAEVKHGGATPPHAIMAWCLIMNHRENLTFKTTSVIFLKKKGYL
jgi:hypothetical protein